MPHFFSTLASPAVQEGQRGKTVLNLASSYLLHYQGRIGESIFSRNSTRVCHASLIPGTIQRESHDQAKDLIKAE